MLSRQMGLFKSLVDKAREKRDELGKKAAKKAATAALEHGTEAATTALDNVGKAIGKAIFGDSDEKKTSDPPPAPDPFAKQKAAEAARKARAEQDERDVDDELAALKRKLGK
jgi:hypothetical protein